MNDSQRAWGKRVLAAVSAVVMAGFLAAPASADPPPPGCERVPILGLNPQIRKICDEPIHPDGSWVRARQFTHPQFVHSSCGGVYYQGGNCPPWMQQDVVPAEEGPIETYIVTIDTIPPGEPGHLD
jgi:hypothetical protein